MLIVKTTSKLKKEIRKIKRRGESIGFVPTMGYLHKAHLSLVRKSKKENDKTVISIFVNPLQFAPGEDFEKYRRDGKKDITLLQRENVDLLFAPDAKELYPEDFKTTVSVKDIRDSLCGASRNGHFDGVCTVVNKLFNLVEPDNAYFGLKDAQQLIIIKKMVKDLNMNVRIKELPTIREKDGLALSSRNTCLTKEERSIAPVLYKSLKKARKMTKKTKDPEKIINAVKKQIVNETENKAVIDYVDIRDFKTLEKTNRINGDILIALAVKIGKTRLIDNIPVKKTEVSNA